MANKILMWGCFLLIFYSNFINVEKLLLVALPSWIFMAALHRIADGLIALNAFFVHSHKRWNVNINVIVNLYHPFVTMKPVKAPHVLLKSTPPGNGHFLPSMKRILPMLLGVGVQALWDQGYPYTSPLIIFAMLAPHFHRAHRR
jgi:hypothetical protein